MPIYEYRCDNCAHEFETIQKLSDEPLKTCPACSQDALRKKVSAAGFRLKGGGWYETDFKNGKKKNVAGDTASTKDSGASKDSGGTSSDSSSAGKSGGESSGTSSSSTSASKAAE